MTWLYLSPHLDDIALSCGGLVWDQTQKGLDVQIWSICAGDPVQGAVSTFAGSLHSRWDLEQDASELRRQEDIASCRVMGTDYRHYPLQDCIYRLGPEGTPSAGRPLYDSEESLWGEVHPDENRLISELSEMLDMDISKIPGCEVVCPLALGGHVDHRLVRRAVEALPLRPWYYEDYPYALQEKDRLAGIRKDGWEEFVFPVSDSGQEAWISAVAAHASQISTFWHQDTGRRVPAVQAMRSAISRYNQERGGVHLWRSLP